MFSCARLGPVWAATVNMLMSAVGCQVGVLLPALRAAARCNHSCCCAPSCATRLPGPALRNRRVSLAAQQHSLVPLDVPGGWLLQVAPHSGQPGLAFLTPTVPAARSRQAAEAGEPPDIMPLKELQHCLVAVGLAHVPALQCCRAANVQPRSSLACKIVLHSHPYLLRLPHSTEGGQLLVAAEMPESDACSTWHQAVQDSCRNRNILCAAFNRELLILQATSMPGSVQSCNCSRNSLC